MKNSYSRNYSSENFLNNMKLITSIREYNERNKSREKINRYKLNYCLNNNSKNFDDEENNIYRIFNRNYYSPPTLNQLYSNIKTVLNNRENKRKYEENKKIKNLKLKNNFSELSIKLKMKNNNSINNYNKIENFNYIKTNVNFLKKRLYKQCI